MKRDDSLQQLRETNCWDVIVIGGGATGVGIALDCTTRGLKTLLVEKNDFSSGTSSKSTKLIHGGVRYLKQLQFKLVYEAIKERKLLLNNSEGLSHITPFVIPVYSTWEKYFLILGLKLYELLSIGSDIGKTKLISKAQTKQWLPYINEKKLKGGVVYYDGQFNDSQICVDIAITANQQGATILNYFKVTDLIKTNHKITGVQCLDTINNIQHAINAKVVVNATGVFSESILKMDLKETAPTITPSQGVHIVLNETYGSHEAALMRPIYIDDRVIFVIPWLGKILVGTTDTKVKEISDDPIALQEEIDFLITTYNQFSNKPISKQDIQSVFCGLRPLITASKNIGTAGISREHTIIKNNSGLITIIGGKWTTYRRMAESVTNEVMDAGQFEKRACITNHLSISNIASKKKAIQEMIASDNSLNKTIHPNYPFTYADVIYSVSNEMAQTIDDILSRRTRLLFLDAKAAITTAPIVAEIMSTALNKNATWKQEQLTTFLAKAKHYTVA